MAKGFRGTIFPQIHQIFDGGTLAGLPDPALLDRFVTRGDTGAFEALIARHGPLVLGVCRSMLRNRDDAEDAFQATFLVLVRKARSISLEDSLGPWLYRVATRVACRARSSATRREMRERCADALEAVAPSCDLDRHDVPPILHDELTRLPERLRAPIVLCYLEGLTHDQVSRQLRCPVGTVRSRLARGRDLLRNRLSRRGVVLSAGALAACCEETATAAIPTALAEATIQAAMRVAAGRAAMHGGISTPVAALMKGVLSAMWISRLKAATAASIVVGALVTIVVSHSVQARDDESDRRGPVAAPAELPEAKPDSSDVRTYYVGDLIVPPGTPLTGEGRPTKLDMRPVMDLLTSTVAPGTWRLNDPTGTAPLQVRRADDRSGSITPFFPSMSLLIRHTPEVHDELTRRLAQLRRIHDLSVPATNPATEPVGARAIPARPSPRRDDANGAVSRPANAERTRELLENLKREVDQLIRERDELQRAQRHVAPSKT